MLAYLDSFSYMSYAVLSGEFVLHSRCCFMWEVSLTRPSVLCGSFSSTPSAVLCGEFLFHAPSCFMCGVYLPRPMLFYVGSFFYTPLAVLCGKFLLHATSCFMWRVSLTRCFIGVGMGVPYTPLAVLCGEILEHGPCYFMWGISLTQSVLIDVGAPLTLLVLIFMEEVCFPCLCYLISGIFRTHPIQVYVRSFSNSIQCVHSCEEFLLYSPYWFMSEISLTIVRALY